MPHPSPPELQIPGYAIVRKIDEGGMGEVYEAWQDEPVRRRVAIKLVKWGMDTEEVVARFESERQALALMSHAHIARVYAAGATPTGRPFFVMEYVEGIPITEHCDRGRLPLRERIALFLQVCAGVQHAHQKGIIHRDIKASNVLVESVDERPSPKIIDFGLAKAMARSELADAGLTQAGAPIGTPEYMSPEQLELSGALVDTRTDVYALGVLLYELLVGSRPFDSRVIIDSGFFEFRRQVLEDDAPRPSTRVRADGAALRQTGVAQLERLVRGDLDWIVGKALEKRPERRYAAVSELAADLGRHLEDEPVQAGPPSRIYRARKFVRRHLLGVVSAVSLVLALGLGIAATSVALVRAVRAENRASSEAERASAEARRASNEAQTARRTADFLVGLFRVVDPGEARGNTVTAREILDRGARRIDEELREEPEVRATLMDSMGLVYSSLGLYGAAQPLLRAALAGRLAVFGPEHELVAESKNHLGKTLRLAGDFPAAEEELRAALDLRRRLLGDHPAVAESLHDLGVVLCDRGEWSEAEPLLREALDMRRAHLGRHPAVAESLNELALALCDMKELTDAESLLREALDLRRELLGRHPELAESLNNLGTFLYEQDRREEALPLMRESLELKRELYGAAHPDVATGLNNLAFALHDAGDLDGAEALYREALEQHRALLGDAHPSVGQALNNLAFVLRDRGDYEGARRAFGEAVRAYRPALGHDHPSVLNALSNGQRLVTEALQSRERTLGADDPETASARVDLAELLLDAGRAAEARAHAEQAWLELTESAGEDWRAARAESVLGMVLAELGQLVEAEELLAASVPRLVETRGAAAPETRRALERLIALYEAADRPEEAERARALVSRSSPGD